VSKSSTHLTFNISQEKLAEALPPHSAQVSEITRLKMAAATTHIELDVCNSHPLLLHIKDNMIFSHKISQAYFAPNDDVENDRLDMHHHLATLMLDGKLHVAPIANPQRILDIGCGTGIWSIEMGR
jgi:hypothetical protein